MWHGVIKFTCWHWAQISTVRAHTARRQCCAISCQLQDATAIQMPLQDTPRRQYGDLLRHFLAAAAVSHTAARRTPVPATDQISTLPACAHLCVSDCRTKLHGEAHTPCMGNARGHLLVRANGMAPCQGARNASAGAGSECARHKCLSRGPPNQVPPAPAPPEPWTSFQAPQQTLHTRQRLTCASATGMQTGVPEPSTFRLSAAPPQHRAWELRQC